MFHFIEDPKIVSNPALKAKLLQHATALTTVLDQLKQERMDSIEYFYLKLIAVCKISKRAKEFIERLSEVTTARRRMVSTIFRRSLEFRIDSE